MRLVDSHCHLDFPDLANDTAGVLADMREHDVTHALCISVTLEDFPKVRALAGKRIRITVIDGNRALEQVWVVGAQGSSVAGIGLTPVSRGAERPEP